MVQVHKESAEQWKDTVYNMIGRGAQIMPDEIEPVVVYLTAAAGNNTQTTQASGRGRQPAQLDGAAILQRTCQQCHELAVATKKPDSANWEEVVGRMTTYGAKLFPSEREKLIEYLIGTAK